MLELEENIVKIFLPPSSVLFSLRSDLIISWDRGYESPHLHIHFTITICASWQRLKIIGRKKWNEVFVTSIYRYVGNASGLHNKLSHCHETFAGIIHSSSVNEDRNYEAKIIREESRTVLSRRRNGGKARRIHIHRRGRTLDFFSWIKSRLSRVASLRKLTSLRKSNYFCSWVPRQLI